MATLVCIEQGKSKAFASALEWPGWCRAAKTKEGALEALADYAPRYALVPAGAGVEFPAGVQVELDVVEELAGNATTDFGAPGIPAGYEFGAVDAEEAARMSGLVVASWELLAKVRAGAPEVLRKGPRGGGRDREKVIEHVVAAEFGYASKLGLKGYKDSGELRSAIATVLATATDAKPRAEKGWPHRYMARRIAWHVLDHAWEIEDKST